MLEPKVIVLITTTTASTAPRMADRTGTALRPTPGSRAKRIPVTAAGGRPLEVATRATLDARSLSNRVTTRWARPGSPPPPRGPRGGPPGRPSRGRRRTSRPVTPTGQGTRWGEGGEWRESHGNQAGQQRPQEDGAQGADEAVADRHPRVGARARSTSSSSVLSRIRRPITCPAMRSAARPAIPPKTPRAIDSGLSVLSARARRSVAWT